MITRTATPNDLRQLARQRFLRGEKLDIAGLAEELGISRATAYRWAGNTDALTGEVIASLIEDTHRQVVREAQGTGWDRILDMQSRSLRYMSTFKPYRDFLEDDPERALRIAASKQGAPQRTSIRLVQADLEAEARAGHLVLPMDAHALAYAIVRIIESFLYADLIANEEPDLSNAVEVLRLLLRP